MSLTIQHQPSSSLCSDGNHTGIWVKATAVGWVLLDKKNLKLILKLHFIVYYLVHVLIFFLLKSCQNSNAFQMVFLSVWMQQTNSWKNIFHILIQWICSFLFFLTIVTRHLNWRTFRAKVIDSVLTESSLDQTTDRLMLSHMCTCLSEPLVINWCWLGWEASPHNSSMWP